MEREHEHILMNFFCTAQHDCRIGKGHLALFAAIYLYWKKLAFPVPLRVFGKQIMPLAKISANSTFHYLMKDLAEFGYLCYVPSFYKGKGSVITFMEVIGNRINTENMNDDP